MGEEKKEVEEKKMEGEGNGVKKEEEKKNEVEEKKEEQKPQEITMKVDMHCEACARKVAKSLKGFHGVEDVIVDYKASKVVVKGKEADPLKVCERIQKKTGRKVELVSPLPIPKPPEDLNKEEPKEEPKQEEKKDEPPAVVTILLKVGMHCEACAQVLQKRIRKIPGVESATADLANEQVTVKGIIDPTQLVNEIQKRTKKQASIIKDEEKKEENEKKEDHGKKEEGEGEKKDAEEGKSGEDTKIDIKKSEYYAPRYYMEYAYPPQFFSDENPNACSIM